MNFGIWELLLVVMIVFVIFGAGKLPRVMGDLGKGIRSMRDGLKGEEEKDEPKRLGQNNPTGVIEQARDHERHS